MSLDVLEGGRRRFGRVELAVVVAICLVGWLLFAGFVAGVYFLLSWVWP